MKAAMDPSACPPERRPARGPRAIHRRGHHRQRMVRRHARLHHRGRRHDRRVKILRYVVVEDCGRVINPAVVDGQVCGGVAQGIGAVLYERAAYDDEGQLSPSTFMDYLLPTSAEIPHIEIHHLETDPDGEFGFRGVGEGGAVVAPATLTNAVDDAHLHRSVSTCATTPAAGEGTLSWRGSSADPGGTHACTGPTSPRSTRRRAPATLSTRRRPTPSTPRVQRDLARRPDGQDRPLAAWRGPTS